MTTNPPRTLREILNHYAYLVENTTAIADWPLLEAALVAYVREREDAATKKEHDRCLLIAERGKCQCEARCNGGQLIADAIR